MLKLTKTERRVVRKLINRPSILELFLSFRERRAVRNLTDRELVVEEAHPVTAFTRWSLARSV